MEFFIEEERRGQWGWRLLGRTGSTLFRSDNTFASPLQARAAAMAFARSVVEAARRAASG
ncbi:hypothetical protein [Methylobacterium isbiliense]|jgi:hypothetical protein|uniref:DUF1508 domain-containing protein n=1 Tax=Methylobacterium isbiliense TaxID=315478 RepID=A0ABQ4SGB7_9HYPH|nr:hypothetical protein [Methylobacterium isbiliense]MDN3624243.1 hypothetical protein [Methylobacterium isbiliense]GJE02276.1 hypothetical protein GMJLKIPL_4220 [Methylobacterium isbiliense]